MKSTWRDSGINTRAKVYVVPERVLRAWIRFNQSWDWLDYRDAPWWYNERASLSGFAGAVWQCGGWAFEEFSTEKVERGSSKQTKRTGRCDLNFQIDGNYFMAEAKQCWPILTSDLSGALGMVQSYLKAACDDVSSVPKWGASRIGICFISPRLHRSKQARADEYMSSFIERVNMIKGITTAWTFPKKARDFHGTAPHDEFAFPGTIMLIKNAR